MVLPFSEVQVALLEATAALVCEKGLPDLTVKDVVERAGVSKGALFHYYESKSALLDAAFGYWMGEFSRRVELAVQGDPIAYGRFTRAYINATIEDLTQEGSKKWAAFSLSSLTEPRRMGEWHQWVNARLRAHGENDPDLSTARFAVDDLWLNTIGQRDVGQDLAAFPSDEELNRIRECIVALTYRKT
ncbi:TPA: TetR/AcrR family transcriptional regulator [Stenotrophomonas maltophilia]